MYPYIDIQGPDIHQSRLHYIDVTTAIAVFLIVLMIVSIAVAVICYHTHKAQAEPAADLHIHDLPEYPPLPPRKGEQVPAGTMSQHTVETTYHSMNKKSDNSSHPATADDGACSKYENHDAIKRATEFITNINQHRSKP